VQKVKKVVKVVKQ